MLNFLFITEYTVFNGRRIPEESLTKEVCLKLCQIGTDQANGRLSNVIRNQDRLHIFIHKWYILYNTLWATRWSQWAIPVSQQISISHAQVSHKISCEPLKSSWLHPTTSSSSYEPLHVLREPPHLLRATQSHVSHQSQQRSWGPQHLLWGTISPLSHHIYVSHYNTCETQLK